MSDTPKFHFASAPAEEKAPVQEAPANPVPGEAKGDLVERAKLRLEQQEADLKAEGKWKEGNDGIVVIGQRLYDPIKVQEGSPDKEYLFANRNRQIREMRRAEGWRETTRTVPDVDGATNYEVGDLVQMEMPKQQYQKTVLEPELQKRQHRISAVEGAFHDAGEVAARETNGGIETYGSIKFDRATGKE